MIGGAFGQPWRSNAPHSTPIDCAFNPRHQGPSHSRRTVYRPAFAWAFVAVTSLLFHPGRRIAQHLVLSPGARKPLGGSSSAYSFTKRFTSFFTSPSLDSRSHRARGRLDRPFAGFARPPHPLAHRRPPRRLAESVAPLMDRHFPL